MASYVGNNITPPYTYSIQSLPLPNVVTAVKDVMFDGKLKFNVHINKIVVRALIIKLPNYKMFFLGS